MSVLSPYNAPSHVIKRLEPGKMVSEKATTFLMRGSRPNGKSTDAFVPGVQRCGTFVPLFRENNQIYAMDAIATSARLIRMAEPRVSCSEMRLISSA